MRTQSTRPICSGPCAAAAARFGVVTAIEFNLFPIAEVYAGVLWYPVDRAAEVLNEWRAWTDGQPEEMTSVGRILQFPPIPEIPEPVRGQSFVVVEAIYLGDEAEGAALLAPLRALGPVLDTIATIPVTALAQLHMDPEEPVPAVGDGGMLTDVDAELVDAIVDATVGSPLLSVEIRHLGGAVARTQAGHGALAAFEAPFVMYSVGFAPTPEAAEAIEGAVSVMREAVAGWEAEHTYMNFADTRRGPRSLFDRGGLRPALPDQGRGRSRGHVPLEPPALERRLEVTAPAHAAACAGARS